MTSIAIILCIGTAFALDYAAIGPDIREKIALLIAAPAIRAGWDGSSVDHWTVGTLHDLIHAGIHATGPTAAVAGLTDAIITTFVAGVFIFAIGMLAPVKATKRIGPIARLTFSGQGSGLKRINPKIWVCAFVLGTMSDLVPGGLIGATLHTSLDWLTPICDQLPSILIGVSA
jgi:hypothetical protein